MKTVYTSRIESETTKIKFGYWHQIDEDYGEFVPVETTKDFAQAAEYLGCSEQLLDTLSMLFDNIKDHVRADLIDIWKKIETL